MKKALTIILSIILTISMLPITWITSSATTVKYDPDKAISFAKSHCATDEKNHSATSGIGACDKGWLCAEFVAECLVAGGFPKKLSAVAGLSGFAGQITNYGEKIESSKTGSGRVKMSTFDKKLSKGDPIILLYGYGSGSGNGHIVIYSGETASDDTLKVYAHNIRKQNEILYADSQTVEIFAVHIETTSSSNTPTISYSKGTSTSEIVIAWNEIDSATKYKVERRKAGDSDYVVAKSSTTATSFTDSGLVTGQRYFYKVTAYNGSTKLGTSEAVGVYTKFASPVITAVSNSKLKITWDSVSKAESYTIMRRKAGDDAYTEIKTVTDTSYTDSGLSASTQYYYWIKADCNVDGTEIVAKSTSAGQYTLTNTPTIKTVNDISKSEIEITWNSVSGADSYRIERRKAGEAEYKTLKSGLTTTSYTDTGLETGQRYYYIVYAKNSAGESAASVLAGGYTKFNSPAITTVSSTKLKLSWDSVAKAENYTIMRRKADKDTYEEITTVTDTAYTDSGLSASTQYYYWIKANCNVDGMEIVAKSTSANQYTFTNAPTIKNVNDISKTEIEITWNSVSGADSYRIERRKAGEAEYKTLKSGLTTTSYTDTGLETGQRYYYIVYAKNSAGESAASVLAGGYTKFNAPTVTTASTTQLNLSWDSVSMAESYTIKRRTYNGEYEDIKTITETSYTDTSLQSGTQYYYWIQANCNIDGLKIIAKSESKGQYTKLVTPNVTTISSSSLQITWDALKGSETYKYAVQRKLPNENNYTTIATITGNSYTDNNLSPSTTYNYRIQVLNNDNKTCSTTDKIDGKTSACSHSYASIITTVATCKNEGVKTFTCSKCGNTYTEKIAENSSNHIGGTEIKNAKASTCTTQGHTGDKYCLGCNAKLETGNIVPVIPHVFTTYISDSNATCLTDGTKTALCDICNEATDTITDDGSKNNAKHINTEWITDIQPTLDVVGHKYKYCIDCKKNIDEADISKLSCGDTNNDGTLNLEDVALLAQAVAGWNVEVYDATLDADGNSEVNLKDLVLLSQFVAGWAVELATKY